MESSPLNPFLKLQSDPAALQLSVPARTPAPGEPSSQGNPGVDEPCVGEGRPSSSPHAATGLDALRGAVTTVAGLAARLPVDPLAMGILTRGLRLRIPQSYLARMGRDSGDPLWQQSIPHAGELEEPDLPVDPLREDDPRHAPVPHLTHRYPDRALLLVTEACPMYCRFCMRRRKTLHGGGVTAQTVERGIAHIARTPAIREVILSGGDPLMLPDTRLGEILGALRAIPHVRVLRIHTRMAGMEPRRITAALARELARHAPLHVCVHFNHPSELTSDARQALECLVDAGLPVHNQAVLLRGVNADAKTLRDLFDALLRCGVHPYYLHHPDLIPGTARFRMSIREGIEVVEALRRAAPYLTMLHYVLDTPGGGGKVPLSPPAQPH
jgi:lysine 2,3-aminomutase